jgi:hypothetical protein
LPPKLHELAVLNELSNIDKHRKLTVVGGYSVGSEIEVMNKEGDKLGIIHLDHTLPSGAGIRVQIPDSHIPPEDMNMKLKSPCHVLFEDAPVTGYDVHEVMSGLVKFVEKEVIPSFDPFFS